MDPSEPAFPTPHITFPNGEVQWGSAGTSIRAYFAANAPKVMWPTFQAVTEPRPGPKFCSTGGDVHVCFDTEQEARAWRNEQPETRKFTTSNKDEVRAWYKRNKAARYVQWPWYYADKVIEASKIKHV